MKMVRSILGSLAVFAALLFAVPAVASVPSAPDAFLQVHQDLKSKVWVMNVLASDHAVLPCKLPVSDLSAASERSIQTFRRNALASAISLRMPSIEPHRRC
jgi:hypothetical protein